MASLLSLRYLHLGIYGMWNNAPHFSSLFPVRPSSYGRELLGLTILLALILSASTMLDGAISNLAYVYLLHLPSCTPHSARCNTDSLVYPPRVRYSNQSKLEVIHSVLRYATHFLPSGSKSDLRLAEVEFALGNFEQAALLLKSSVRHPSDATNGTGSTQPVTILVNPDRHESHILRAYQQSAVGETLGAIQSFRIALVIGAQDIDVNEHKFYFHALADRFSTTADSSINDARLAYLAGKYYFLAGNHELAESWFLSAQEIPDWKLLGADDQARTYLYLGMIYERKEDIYRSLAAYQIAAELSESLRPAKMMLLLMLNRTGNRQQANDIELDLTLMGPTFLLPSAPSRSRQAGASTDSRMLLYGFEVDEETLGTAGVVDIWFWWRAVEPTSSNSNGVNNEEYSWFFDRQVVANLAPNGGFEWGTEQTGLPIGSDAEIYNASVGSVHVHWDESPMGVPTQVLRLSNQQDESVGLRLNHFRVEERFSYLLAGWKNSTQPSQGYLGLSCDAGGPVPFYIDPEHSSSTASNQEWIHHSGLLIVMPPTTTCGVLLSSYSEQGGRMDWDNVFLMSLDDRPMPRK